MSDQPDESRTISNNGERTHQDDLATAALADLLGVPPFVVDEQITEDDEDGALTISDQTYAERWADAINETYADSEKTFCGEEFDHDEVRQVLTKAADCLRGGQTHSFSGGELDLVRHLMPAHEVHQSGARRWVLDHYGSGPE